MSDLRMPELRDMQLLTISIHLTAWNNEFDTIITLVDQSSAQATYHEVLLEGIDWKSISISDLRQV